MPENTQPEPEKSKSEAAPKTASGFAPSDGARGSAYVPLPGRGGGPRLGLALAALAAAGALAGGALWMRGPSVPAPAAVQTAAEAKVLWFSDADLSAEATEKARRAPPPPAAATASPASPERAAPAVSAAPAAPATAAGPAAETRPSSPLPVVPPELKNAPASAPQSVLTPQGAAAVRSDGYSLFRMRLLDSVDQDGDVVQISVDGVPMSYVSLTHSGATLEIPLKKGESHTVTVTAVKDGVGGITLGLSTSVGDLMSRTMTVGESETWTIGFK